MARPVQEIEVEKVERGGIKMTHPAFGQLSASRVHGRQALYGSDFEHNAYITIRLSESELHRDLSRDWPYAKKQLFEVALSEAQWATFVSAMNVGEGVQCTIEHRHDKGYVPKFTIPDRTAQYKAEFGNKLKGTLESIDTMTKHVEAMGLPKGKTQEIISALRMIKQGLASNLPFVAESFDEHVEETVEKAKTEVHGYMLGVLQRAGLEKLWQDAFPLIAYEDRDKPVIDSKPEEGK